MKLYFLFAIMDFLILLAYPLAYIANRLQKLAGERPSRRRE
jgi:hypothetical protein